jgi:hypothetical protein
VPAAVEPGGWLQIAAQLVGIALVLDGELDVAAVLGLAAARGGAGGLAERCVRTLRRDGTQLVP